MSVTLEGMSMEVRLVQSQKAYSPMLVTLEGMVMEVKPEQPQKAHPPILVTLEGMIVFLQPAISVLEDVSMMALLLLRESYSVLPEATVTEVKPEQ